VGTQEYAASVVAVLMFFVIRNLERNGFWETLGTIGIIFKYLFKIYSLALLGLVFIGGLFWGLMQLGIPREYGAVVWFVSIVLGGGIIIKITDRLGKKT
jgi:hypothetical protein